MLDIKRYRKEKKLTQLQVAEVIGVDQARISKYERGIEVTEFLNEKLLKNIPELENYIIPDEPENKEIGTNEIIDELRRHNKNLTLFNQKLIEQIDELKEEKKELNKRIKEMKKELPISSDQITAEEALEALKVILENRGGLRKQSQ